MTTSSDHGEVVPARGSSRIYVAGTIGAMLAVLVLNGVCHVGLYADGAYYFLGLLSERFYFVASWYRLGATLLTQTSVVLALDLGVTSMAALAFLHSVCLTLVPVLCFSTSTVILRRNGLALVANTVMVACCYLPVSFYAVGEFNVLYALFWLTLSLLLFVGSGGRNYFRVLFVVGLFLAASYELSLVTGAILASIALLRRAGESDAITRQCWNKAIAIFLAGSLVGLAGIVLPRDAANASGFGEALHAIAGNDLLYVLCLVVLLSAVAAYASRPGLLVLAAVALGLWLIHSRLTVAISTTELNLGDQSRQRAQVFPIVLFAAALLILAGLRPRWLAFPEHGRAWPLLIPLATMLVIYGSDIAAWRGFTRDICRELRMPEAGDAAFFRRNRVERYGWYWTWPVMSVLYRPATSDRLLLDPSYHGWMAFDRPAEAPDINRYKVASSLCGA